MILFILLFAMGSVNQEKYEKLSESMSNSMGKGAGLFSGTDSVLPKNGNDSIVDLGNSSGGNNSESTSQATVTPTQAAEESEAPSVTDIPKEDTTPVVTQGGTNTADISGSLENQQDMIKFQDYVNEIVADMNISASTTIIESGLLISFADDAFFDSGQDILKSDMKKGLNQIAELLNKVDNSVIIEGHTDNIPISKTNKYTSNWQLSAARAANVAQYLVEKEKVDGARLSAVGYGAYRPVATNDTIKGRSQNRRVDIIVLYNSEIGFDFEKLK
jgi:chemotaxis protein MotB